MIHHISLTALQPRHVAETLAMLMGGQAFYFPVCENAYIVLQGDAHGTAIEVNPKEIALFPGETADGSDYRTVPQRASLHSGFHVYLSVAQPLETLTKIAQSAGWHTQMVRRQNAFDLLEVWIENHTMLEFTAESDLPAYVAFMQPGELSARGWALSAPPPPNPIFRIKAL
jgi:hypothetical protein